MRTKDGIKGSIYQARNKIVIDIFGKKHYTGLDANVKSNWIIAQRIKKNLFLEANGIKTGMNEPIKEHAKRINEVWKEYYSFAVLVKSDKTQQAEYYAYKKIVKNNIEMTENNIDKMIQKFVSDNKDKIKAVSINTYLRSFQVFLNWCVKNKIIENTKNYKQIYRQKEDTKRNTYFTLEEINKIIEYAKQTDVEFAYLIEFLFYSGCRINEALSLTKNDIKSDRITLHNKISKELEYIYISPNLQNVINKITELNNNNKLFRFKCKSNIWTRLNKIMVKVGIDKDGRNIHSIRKSYLKYLYDKNVPLQVAQKLMRHRDIKITIKNYTEIGDEEIKKHIAYL